MLRRNENNNLILAQVFQAGECLALQNTITGQSGPAARQTGPYFNPVRIDPADKPLVACNGPAYRQIIPLAQANAGKSRSAANYPGDNVNFTLFCYDSNTGIGLAAALQAHADVVAADVGNFL